MNKYHLKKKANQYIRKTPIKGTNKNSTKKKGLKI
jgi:hypothetical protein